MEILWLDSQIEASRTRTEIIRKQHKQHKTRSRAWWQSVKSVTGEKRSDNSQPYQFIGNTWLNCDDFCDKLNNYYVNIAGDVESSLYRVSLA